MNKPKAVIYTRVSSDRQIDNTSLADQLKKGKEYCERRGLEFVTEFREEGESAELADRTILKEALNYCGLKKNDITYFLVFKFDRFSRSVENHHLIKAILSRSGVKLISMTEETPDTPAGRLTENMLATIAQFDNEVRTERCINGIKAKLRQGIWVYDSPLGYMKDTNFKGSGAKPDIPDPAKFEIVKEGWKMMLTGRYRSKDVLEFFHKKGLRNRYGNKLIAQSVSKIFYNKFYAGLLFVDSFGIEEKGQHQPMITLDEFYAVQAILAKYNNGNQVKHLGYNPEFPLNKTIKCTCCGKFMTGAWSKQKGVFGYYACRRPECKERDKIKKADAETSFIELLERITPSQELVDLYKEAVTKVYLKKLREKEDIQRHIKSELNELEVRLSKLEELVETDVYSVEKFKEKSKPLVHEIAVKKVSLSETNIDLYDAEECVNYSVNFLQLLPKYWISLSVKAKHRLHEVLFPEGLILENGRVTTKALAQFYNDIEAISDGNVPSGTPGGSRTPNLRFRRPLLYPLSYGCA